MNSIVRFFDVSFFFIKLKALSVLLLIIFFFYMVSGCNLAASKTKIITEIFYEKPFDVIFFFDNK